MGALASWDEAHALPAGAVAAGVCMCRIDTRGVCVCADLAQDRITSVDALNHPYFDPIRGDGAAGAN